ncbi:hypothetical protein QCA50_010195 [Cerrena zonata]|uniref:Uncharacterized protein n=1 Tax=Cerrena zonata TaxID=2478898 RepID=A0AAW0FZF5_9APHY
MPSSLNNIVRCYKLRTLFHVFSHLKHCRISPHLGFHPFNPFFFFQFPLMSPLNPLTPSFVTILSHFLVVPEGNLVFSCIVDMLQRALGCNPTWESCGTPLLEIPRRLVRRLVYGIWTLTAVQYFDETIPLWPRFCKQLDAVFDTMQIHGRSSLLVRSMIEGVG